MIIKTAEYIKSSVDPRKCPEPVLPEYAFIGRSNVGKSSLINMITGVSGLAKISTTPGKTQLINHFLINGQWYLVDLPGYGFAKASKSDKKSWQSMSLKYFAKRENLMSIFVLVDSRIKPQKIDIDFINVLGENGVPFVIIMTKCDKVSFGHASNTLSELKTILSLTWEELPISIITSSKNKLGRDEILDYIEKTNKSFIKPDLSKNI
jgi:GTP-binding protein